ncbi:MAG: YhbD family protein [Clostridia bacterium]|nr:YhbD family protein [Clostridia bacterium]MDR3644383.1 YhbD family protein [Clostridia bacterium]
MEEELVSKKELLEMTGISYGQLYRWKRKGLIPEQWFIRKSTFTGQETFFPRRQVLARVEKIKSMKEDINLDDLADVFSPSVSGILLSGDEIVKRNIVTEELYAMYRRLRPQKESFAFGDLLCVTVFSRAVGSGMLSLDEGAELLRLLEAGGALPEGGCELILARKLGVFVCFLVSNPCTVVLDAGLKLISRSNLANDAEELKLKLF